MAGSQGGGTSQMLMLLSIMAVFYLFMIYPQMKKSKAQKKFRESIEKGTRIVTLGGIHAKINEVGDTWLIIESEGTRLKIDKTAVSMESTQALNAPVKKG
jgi:preprotein translocase subunit YajC